MATTKKKTSGRKPTLDLDAAFAEALGAGKMLRFMGQEYDLPAELPADVLVPLIDPKLDLLGVVRDFIDGTDEDDDTATDDLVEKVLSRSDLPQQVWDAFHESLRRLFDGVDLESYPNHARLVASRPSIPGYARLVMGLFNMYAVSLGEVSGPSESSENAGGSSKEISSSTTE